MASSGLLLGPALNGVRLGHVLDKGGRPDVFIAGDDARLGEAMRPDRVARVDVDGVWWQSADKPRRTA